MLYLLGLPWTDLTKVLNKKSCEDVALRQVGCVSQTFFTFVVCPKTLVHSVSCAEQVFVCVVIRICTYNSLTGVPLASPENWTGELVNTPVEFTEHGQRKLGLLQRPQGKRWWWLIDEEGNDKRINRWELRHSCY